MRAPHESGAKGRFPDKLLLSVRPIGTTTSSSKIRTKAVPLLRRPTPPNTRAWTRATIIRSSRESLLSGSGPRR